MQDLLGPVPEEMLHTIYAAADKDTDINLLTNICWFFDLCFHHGRFQTVDDLLERLSLERVGTVYIIAVLRYSCCAREELPHFDTTLSKARVVLVSRGLDAARLLRGLEKLSGPIGRLGV